MKNKPFWNAQCAEIAPRLWLPIELEPTVLSQSLSAETIKNTWFSSQLYACPIDKTALKITFTDSINKKGADSIIKSRLVRLYPNKQQKAEFHYWLTVSRFVFNWTIDFIRSCIGWTPSWMEIKKCATQQLPAWTKNCPFQIKAIAIKDAHTAFFKAKGHPKFRSRKNPVQSCFIPTTAIKADSIYPRVSGKGLRYAEPLPESYMDSRLVWKTGKFFIALPKTSLRVHYGENQARVVAIDPGVRTFAAFYASDSCGLLGKGDFSRLHRLAISLDGLVSSLSKAGKQRKRRMRLAAARIREKAKNLVAELHHKTALFLVNNFDVILLPTFEIQQMSSKLKNKTVRSLLSFAHYRFKQFLKHKAFEYNKQVIDVCESYTSKTHPETGEVRNIGSAKHIRLLSGEWVNRDLVGARNILLRALVDSPDCFSVAVAES